MLVILNIASGPIAVQTDQIRAIVPNADDSACIISFSDSHTIEVIGSLAKVRGKLEGAVSAPAASSSSFRAEPAASPPARATPPAQGEPALPPAAPAAPTVPASAGSRPQAMSPASDPDEVPVRSIPRPRRRVPR